MADSNTGELRRSLGVFDAVTIGLGSMLGRRDFRRARPGGARGGLGAAAGPGGGRGGGVLQRHLVRPAGRPLPRIRWHLCLRPRAAGRFLGIPGGVGLRRRQDRLVRRDGLDHRLLCVAVARAPGCRRRGGGTDRGELRRGAEVCLAHPRHRRARVGRVGRGGRRRILLGNPRRRTTSHRRERPSVALFRPRACCSSPSPVTRASPPWAKRFATRRAPSRARYRSPLPSPWPSMPWWRRRRSGCWGHDASVKRRRRWSTPCGRPGRAGWSRSCRWARPLRRSAPCWR